jgi:diadenosine tetraphosphate (Ap4A) HIT family hydrolase
MNLELDWTLHPQLAADTVLVGRFALSELRLMRDANYPWCLLVPRRAGAREIHLLAEADQLQLLRESSRLAAAMAALFGADKMNVAALGNVVPQLHVHHIVRHVGDPAWPAPVWGRMPAQPYAEAALAERLLDLRAALAPELQVG